MKQVFYPAESLRFYRLPLTLFVLMLAVFATILFGMAAEGVETDAKVAFLFLRVVGGIAVLFLAFCLWQLRRRGLLLQEESFTDCGRRYRSRLYSEIGCALVVPKTISTGRGRDIPVKKDNKPIFTLFLMERRSAERTECWRKNIRLGSQAFQANFGEDIMGQALYTESLLQSMLRKNPDMEIFGLESQL